MTRSDDGMSRHEGDLSTAALATRQELVDAAWDGGWSPNAITLLLRLIDRGYDATALCRVITGRLAGDRPRRVLAWLHVLSPGQVTVLATERPYQGSRYSRPHTQAVLRRLEDRARAMVIAPHAAMLAWTDVVGRDLAPYAYAAGLTLTEADDLHASGRLDLDMLHALADVRSVPALLPSQPL